MSDAQALLADLRALADDLRRDMEELPGHPQWNQWYIEESHLRRLIAKHTPEPDVSERDELAQIIHAQDCNCSDVGHDEDYEAADAILAAGWRRT